MKNKRVTIQEVKNRLIVKNIELIDKYINTQTKAIFKCYCGKIFETTPNSIFRGYTRSCGCYKNDKLSTEEVNKRLFKYNISLVGEYKGALIKTELRCACGKVWWAKPNSIFNGHTRSCGCYNKLCLKERMKNLVDQEINEIKVLKLLPKLHTKYEYRCLCHCGKEFNVIGCNLVKGNTKSCGCLQNNKFGNKNPNYNPNLTEQDRINRRLLPEYKDWSKQILERDNYICQICGQYGGKLNAHHLNSWHWCNEQKYDLHNGITLCEDCHNDFHYIYGKKWNTLEEFNEYELCSA